MRNKIVAAAVAAACLASVSTYAAEEKTTISGLAFIDLTDISSKVTTKATGAEVNGASNGYGLDLKRFYIGIDHQFGDVWSVNLTTDTMYSSYASTPPASVGTGVSQNATTSDSHIFVKKAYVQAKFDDAFVLRIGSYDTPWMGMIDGLYGYRYVEKSLNDLNGVAQTADWGLHASGMFGDGQFGYAVSLVDGAGYKNPVRSKGMDLEGRFTYSPIKGLTLALGGYTGKRGQDTQTIANDPTKDVNTFTRLNVAVAYVVEQFRAGAEYYTLKNLNSVVTNAPGTLAGPDTDKQNGWSIWGAYNFLSNASVFARYDDTKINPSDTLVTSKEDTKKYIQLGVTYSPRKNVDFALAYKNTKLDTNYGATSTKTDEIGVWSQVKF
jgi:hypothetical protein